MLLSEGVKAFGVEQCLLFRTALSFVWYLLTATIAPSYCDNGKISFSISQISPGMGAGVTNRLQVGGDPGHGVPDPATVCKKKLNLNVFWLIIHCPACHSFFTFMLLAWLLRVFESAVPRGANLKLQTVREIYPQESLFGQAFIGNSHLLKSKVPTQNLKSKPKGIDPNAINERKKL